MTVRKKIGVLHLIKTLKLGGAEKNLFNLIMAFDPNQTDVHVGYSGTGEFEASFRDLPVRLFKFSDNHCPIKSAATLPIVFRLVRYILGNGIDIVHTHSFNTYVWGSVAAKICRVKLIEHVHDARYMDAVEYKNRRGTVTQFKYIRYMKNMADRVVILTDGEYEFLLKRKCYDECRIRKIQNGIPLNGAATPQEDTSLLREKYGVRQDSAVVLTTLRVSPEKNVDLIFRIAPDVKKIIPNAIFFIAGDGPQYDEFKSRCRELNDCVRMIGFQPDIHSLLRISDIFILPSFLELHSIAILEAMSMKVPIVISRDVGCHNEFIDTWRNGVLADPFSDDGWKNAIIRLLQNPDLRKEIGQKGYETCLNRFDIKEVAKKFEILYAELIRE